MVVNLLIIAAYIVIYINLRRHYMQVLLCFKSEMNEYQVKQVY